MGRKKERRNNEVLRAIKELDLDLDLEKSETYNAETLTLDSLVEIINENTETSCNIDTVYEALKLGKIEVSSSSICHDPVLLCGVNISTVQDLRLLKGKIGIMDSRKKVDVYAEAAKHFHVIAEVLENYK